MPPDPALLSSSSPYRAPSPVWPSSRSSREHLLRTAAASPWLPPSRSLSRSRGLPEGSPRTPLAAPAPAHPQTRGWLPMDCVMFSSLAAYHPPPDTLFFWVFQLLFLIFLALLPGLALQAFPWSRGRGCGRAFPRWQPAEECARGSPWEGLSPLWVAFCCRLWSPLCRSGIPRADPGALLRSSPVQAAVPGAPLGSRACSSGVL